jgi:5,5'-dehydrodivanillate O-demethylase
MLSEQENAWLTQVGPGTPMGRLLRCYWQPIATTAELARQPVIQVKLLGETLALYRDERGGLGLVAERCPHRGASLAYGIPEEDGLRCPYHGWKFDAEGRCLEQPAEPEDSNFCSKVRIAGYPVQEMGGLVFAYLGQQPAPLLPRWDLFVRDDLDREVMFSRLPCNWLQIQENSMDPMHVDFLHNNLNAYLSRRQGKPIARVQRTTARFDFTRFEFGYMKRRLWEGEREEDDPEEWRVGHAMVFPNATVLAGQPPLGPNFQFRVPIDDSTTLYWWYLTRQPEPGAPKQQPEDIPMWENHFTAPDGRLLTRTVTGQDIMTWVSQGPVADRTDERLGTSDRGIILLRRLLKEELAKVDRGEDPMGIIRDPARNELVYIPREERWPERYTTDYSAEDRKSVRWNREPALAIRR